VKLSRRRPALPPGGRPARQHPPDPHDQHRALNAALEQERGQPVQHVPEVAVVQPGDHGLDARMKSRTSIGTTTAPNQTLAAVTPISMKSA